MMDDAVNRDLECKPHQDLPGSFLGVDLFNVGFFPPRKEKNERKVFSNGW